MSVTETAEVSVNGDRPQLSLSTVAARQLATTTKTVPQMQEISSRWLLRVLPWVQVSGGVYRVNRRLTYMVGDGRVTFTTTGTEIRVIPQELTELALLRDFDDIEALTALAGRFVQREVSPGDVIVQRGQPADQIVLIAHGKANKIGAGKYGEDTVLAVLTDGDHFTYQAILETDDTWPFTVQAVSRCTVLTLSQEAFEQLVAQSESLRAHVEAFRTREELPANRFGEKAIEMSSSPEQEEDLPGTYVDYEASPREYHLSMSSTVLRVQTRVADLYNNPMDQVQEQLRLTVEALRERQEHEMINNPEFGLLHNADLSQRIPTRSGPPTPDDLDELLTRRRKTQFLFAHPRAIAAFGRECNRRGVYPDSILMEDEAVSTWRGVPVLPCNKIPVSDTGTTSILAMRTGEADQGVVGLHQTGIPDEYQPSMNVRFMGINEKSIISYLVTAYYSAAVLVPDALGILEDVETGL